MAKLRDDAAGRRRDRSPRADAERNRARIVHAARRSFATDGLGVSMASVARAAGVGKATLSRHFAAREDLINAAFADRMDDYLALSAEALADPDAWRAFTTGHLHDDFASEDLVILPMANAGVIAATAGAAPGSWGRLVGHMLRAFANPGAPVPPIPAAPSSVDLCHDRLPLRIMHKAVQPVAIGA